MSSEQSSISERTRLLPKNGAIVAVENNDGDNSFSSSVNDGPQVGTSRRITIATLCMLLLLTVQFAATLLSISISQIQEGNICHSFYPDVDDATTDPRCKDENVQSELSTLQGWGFTFAIIPSLITAVPYGVAADKYGRRIILSLSVLGNLLVEVVVMIICKYMYK